MRTLDGREQENFYDGEGLRAGMTENGRKTTFLYHNGEILAECDGESAPIRRYLRGIGLSQVQTLDDNVFHSCHQDEQGSTAYITGQGRETENSYQYDAFGNLIERKEAITNRILYTGQQYDQETGQYYLRARYYNPVVGRFLQEDTYRGDGLNLYAYCANNPVMYYDPSGHSLKSWFENLCKKVAEFFGDDTPGNQAVNGNGLNSINNLDDLLPNPDYLSGISGNELYDYLTKNGYDVQPLSRGSYKGIPFEEGGGFKVNWGGDRILQYHPENLSHHNGAYFKISSGETGTIRIDLNGNIIE